MTTQEERQKTENEAVSDLEKYEYIKINFGDTENVRDHLEQQAAHLLCTNASQQTAVSDYLAELQRPPPANLTPAQMVYETNKLLEKFPKDTDLSKDPNLLPRFGLERLAWGLAAHNDVDAYAKGPAPAETTLDKMIDKVENFFSAKPAPSSGPK